MSSIRSSIGERDDDDNRDDRVTLFESPLPAANRVRKQQHTSDNTITH